MRGDRHCSRTTSTCHHSHATTTLLNPQVNPPWPVCHSLYPSTLAYLMSNAHSPLCTTSQAPTRLHYTTTHHPAHSLQDPSCYSTNTILLLGRLQRQKSHHNSQLHLSFISIRPCPLEPANQHQLAVHQCVRQPCTRGKRSAALGRQVGRGGADRVCGYEALRKGASIPGCRSVKGAYLVASLCWRSEEECLAFVSLTDILSGH